MWDAATGRLIHAFPRHSGDVTAVAFSADGTRAISCSTDTTTRLWDPDSGQELVRLIASADGEWLAMTPAGFFAASKGGPDLVAVVRGTDTYSMRQFFEFLYQPELVSEVLKDDPEVKYLKAARELSLTTILDSGPAPTLELLSSQTELLGSIVRVKVRIKDEGGGIGHRVIWRVDGRVQGDTLLARSSESGNLAITEQVLKVDPGHNHSVEIVAYNKVGLLASQPLRLTVNAFGASIGAPLRMHVLAIGITDYEKADWHLNLAASDATVFGDAMRIVGEGLFGVGMVKVTLVLNSQATLRGIEAAFAKIARDPELGPSDVFVLYLAGHGRYDGARYYFIQQDLSTDRPPKGRGQLIRQDAIGQDTLQRWIASIQVDKRVIFLDTCESAPGGGSLIRALATPRLTAMEQLQHATGDNLIAAAGQAAFESNKLGHGLLTYAILEALSAKGDADRDERVTVDMIASYVTERVPKLSREIFGEEQWPIRKLSSGLPIPLGFRRFRLQRPSPPEAIFRDFILMRDEVVYTRPDQTAVSDPPIRLQAPMIVDIVGFSEDRNWVRIRWGSGIGVGWVHTDAVVRPHATPQ
jgi:hypothetical protein